MNKKILSLKKTEDSISVSKNNIPQNILNKLKTKYKQNFFNYRTAKEVIPEGYCLSLLENGLYSVSSTSNNIQTFSGVAVNNFSIGERGCFITRGVCSHKIYKFNEPFGNIVWVSPDGIPSDALPKYGFLNPIGISIDKNSFLLLDKSDNNCVSVKYKFISTDRPDSLKIVTNGSGIYNVKIFEKGINKKNNVFGNFEIQTDKNDFYIKLPENRYFKGLLFYVEVDNLF